MNAKIQQEVESYAELYQHNVNLRLAALQLLVSIRIADETRRLTNFVIAGIVASAFIAGWLLT